MVQGAWLGTHQLWWIAGLGVPPPPLVQTHNHGCQNQSQAGPDLVCSMGTRAPAYSNAEVPWTVELSSAWHTAGA